MPGREKSLIGRFYCKLLLCLLLFRLIKILGGVILVKHGGVDFSVTKTAAVSAHERYCMSLICRIRFCLGTSISSFATVQPQIP